MLKSTAAIGKQAGGFYLLPTNQLLRPWGEQALIPGRPVDLTFDSGKRILAVLNTRSVVLFDGSTGAKLAEIKARATSYTGIAFRPGDRELWASEATRNGPDSILVAQLSELGMPGKVDHIELKGHPVPAGIAFSPDGKTAYVAFSRNNTLAVIDAETRADPARNRGGDGAVRRGGGEGIGQDLRVQSRRAAAEGRTIPWRHRAARRS